MPKPTPPTAQDQSFGKSAANAPRGQSGKGSENRKCGVTVAPTRDLSLSRQFGRHGDK